MDDPSMAATVAVTSLLAGAVFVGVTYKGLELGGPVLSALSGVGYAVGAVVAARFIGNEFLSPMTWSEFEVLVLTASIAACVGAGIVVMCWKPELDESDPMDYIEAESEEVDHG